jgi:carotenoid cleavage dioxygenase
LDYAANTHVIDHAGRILALVEAGPRPIELTDDLETVGPCDFDETLPRGFTAHPKRDPVTGDLHAVTYYWGRPGVQYLTIGVDGRVRREVDLAVPGSPMMHDFALTEKYVLILDLPVAFDAAQVASTVPWPLSVGARALLPRIIGAASVPDGVGKMVASRGRDLFPYTWKPHREARVGVLSRDGGGDDVRWFPVEPCFVFHTVNAYEQGTRWCSTSCGTRKHSTATVSGRTKGARVSIAGPFASGPATSRNAPSTTAPGSSRVTTNG